jgi:hypothetical protein
MADENINTPGYLTVMWLFLIGFIVYIIRHYALGSEFPYHTVW